MFCTTHLGKSSRPFLPLRYFVLLAFCTFFQPSIDAHAEATKELPVQQTASQDTKTTLETGDAEADQLDAKAENLITAGHFEDAVPLAEQAFGRRKTQMKSGGVLAFIGYSRSFNNLYKSYQATKQIDKALNIASEADAVMKEQQKHNNNDNDKPDTTIQAKIADPKFSQELFRISQEFIQNVMAGINAAALRKADAKNGGANTASGDKEADALDNQVKDLMAAKRFDEAISLAERTVSLRESRIKKPDAKKQLAVLRSLLNLARVYKAGNRPGSLLQLAGKAAGYVQNLDKDHDALLQAQPILQEIGQLAMRAGMGGVLPSSDGTGENNIPNDPEADARNGIPGAAFGGPFLRDRKTTKTEEEELRDYQEMIDKSPLPIIKEDLVFMKPILSDWKKEHGDDDTLNLPAIPVKTPSEEASLLSFFNSIVFEKLSKDSLIGLYTMQQSALSLATNAATDDAKTDSQPAVDPAEFDSSLTEQYSALYSRSYGLLTLAEQNPSQESVTGRAFLWTLQNKGERLAIEIAAGVADNELGVFPRYAALKKQLKEKKKTLYEALKKPHEKIKTSDTETPGGQVTPLSPGNTANLSEAQKNQATIDSAKGGVFTITQDMNALLIEAIKKSNGGYVDPEAIRRALPSHSALLEFVRYQQSDWRKAMSDTTTRPDGPMHYGVFVFSSETGRPVAFLPLGDAKTIDEAVETTRAAFVSESGSRGVGGGGAPTQKQGFVDSNRALYKRVFAPVIPLLTQLGVKEITIAPDGKLAQIPFEVLQDDSNKYLLEKYVISYVTTGRDLLRSFGTEKGSGVAIFCNPDYNAPLAFQKPDGDVRPPYRPVAAARMQFVPLSGTLQEGEKVEQLTMASPFGTTRRYSGVNASEANLKSLEHPVSFILPHTAITYL